MDASCTFVIFLFFTFIPLFFSRPVVQLAYYRKFTHNNSHVGTLNITYPTINVTNTIYQKNYRLITNTVTLMNPVYVDRAVYSVPIITTLSKEINVSLYTAVQPSYVTVESPNNF